MKALSEIPDPGMQRWRRYSRRPFPAYRFVPGLHPHPLRDPTGHSYEPVPSLLRHAAWEPAAWATLDDWLYGVDLFNHFYFWEAHEAWEGLWAATERGDQPLVLLQGLIQIAAALLKTHMRSLNGARALSAKGIGKLEQVADRQQRLLGLDVRRTAKEFAAYFSPLEHSKLPVIGSTVPVLALAAG